MYQHFPIYAIAGNNFILDKSTEGEAPLNLKISVDCSIRIVCEEYYV